MENQQISQVNNGSQNELPPIFKHVFNGVTKDAIHFRELYFKLGLHEKSFRKWCENNIEALFIESEEWHFLPLADNTSVSHKKGRKAYDFIVPIDIAKELSMLARTEHVHSKLIKRINSSLEITQL